ncbi:MAG: hypothetical protein HY914_08545 [Desulfomonile tiedjei]|nr:hypothetical protein [Desulfomonile tiedjei]
MTITWSPGTIQGSVRSRVRAWGIGLTMIVVLAFGGCYRGGKTDGGPALEDESAIRETQDIAAMAASLVNVYMDARVSEMLVCSAIGSGRPLPRPRLGRVPIKPSRPG